MAALLDRLGEGPPRTPGHETSRPSTAQTAESEVPYKETESSAAPIMVIRDLATDTGPKPSSDIRSMSAVLDDLIAPDLALTLITMYAAPSFPKSGYQ